MKYGQRIKAAREHAKLTQAQLCKKTGSVVTQQAISHLEGGDATGSEYTVQFAIACGVSPEWLAMGHGEMKQSALSVREPNKTYEVRDPVLDDLAALEPEDADVWRAQIKAAAIKARKAREEEERKVSERTTPEPKRDRRHA